jgi:sulfate adenylyltransferase
MTQLGWNQVMAFPTHHGMHRPQFELTRRAMGSAGAQLLIHAVVGLPEHGDAEYFCRVRCYQAMLPRYPEGRALLSLLPLATRFAGPREAVLQAIVERNYGCRHLLIGPHHAASPAETGAPASAAGAAGELLRLHAEELGVAVTASDRVVYVPESRKFVPAGEVAAGETAMDLGGAEARRVLRSGRNLPDWFTFPEIAAELRVVYPPRSKQGFTVFFTGLSGAGKSTVAKALLDKLLEIGGRPVTMLDGDIVRKNLSSELGFSREHRDLNIRRIGFVANQITKNGGIAICAPIAPYDRIRREVRDLIAGQGGFILVYAATPLEVCEQRDRKGLYAKARAGILKEFTGISDPYEIPPDAEVVLNTAELGVEEACNVIIRHLRKEGYLPVEAPL